MSVSHVEKKCSSTRVAFLLDLGMCTNILYISDSRIVHAAVKRIKHGPPSETFAGFVFVQTLSYLNHIFIFFPDFFL